MNKLTLDIYSQEVIKTFTLFERRKKEIQSENQQSNTFELSTANFLQAVLLNYRL